MCELSISISSHVSASKKNSRRLLGGYSVSSVPSMAPWLQVVSEDITFWHAPGFKGSGAAEKPWKWTMDTMDTMDIDG